MRTSNKTQRQREVGRVLARALLIVFLWVPWVPRRVTGNCGVSTGFDPGFNLSAFSPATVTLVSHSWIDTSGSIRMAPPILPNTTYQSNTSMTGVPPNAMGMGQVLYKAPVSLVDPRTNNSVSFSTFFSFSLISVMQVPPTSNGMAFVIMPEQSTVLGTPMGGPPLFAPYNAVWWDASSNTFAVQLEKWNQSNSTPVNQTNVINVQPSAANTYGTYLQDGATNFAWINYDATRLHLQVSISNTTDGAKWTLLSTTCDLSSVFLNPTYIGFYSRDKVSVSSWTFSAAGCPPLLPGPNIRPPPQQPPPDPESRNVTGTNNSQVTKSSWFSRNRQLLIYVGAGTGCAFLIGLLGLLAAVLCRSCWFLAKYRGAKSVPNRDIPFTPQIFTYRTLSMATNGFDERALLGRGGFGSVYKGILAEDEWSSLVAVKRIESKNDAQRERQFIAEVSSIGRLKHRNLVQLLGWCHEKGELLLVYDYIPNGSLDRLLFGTQEKVLPWESRYNIVSGVAEALAYLHGEWEKQVVHRDVKASNVLLDSNFNPRLGDFGLARLGDHNKNPKSTSVAGTLGYLAPEITITGKATDKTDVFSFGALALEVACGRRPIERTLPPQEIVLVDWVWELHNKGEIMNAVDSRLPRGRLPSDKVATLLNVGLLCSHPDPSARPSMRQVVRILSGEISCPAVPDSKPIPPFAAYRRAPDHYYSTPTTRAMMASTKLSSNKISSKTQSRVSDCSSLQ